MPMSKNTSNDESVDAFTALFGNPSSKLADTESADVVTPSENEVDDNQTNDIDFPNEDANSVFPTAEPVNGNDVYEQEFTPNDLDSPAVKDGRQPLLGYLWDQLPQFVRDQLQYFGYKPPFSALKTSPLNSQTGNREGLLIGPPGAGKTTLIAALHRSCLIPVHSEIDLRWKGGTDSNSQKELSGRLTEALNQILSGSTHSVSDRKGSSSTWDVTKYNFNIEGRLRHPRHFNSLKLFDMVLSFYDGPGGALFVNDENEWPTQADNRRIMVKDSRNAYTLLFCLDGSQKLAHYMQSNLSRILPLLQDHQRNDGYIPPKRVMILLNKVDQLATNLYEQIGHGYSGQIIPITPKDIANEMDPFQMAVECIGYASLKMIRDSMSADAELAVGLISNWGFKATGYPLVDKEGNPIFLSELNRGDENDFVSQWHPFGVRECLIYLATGRVDSMIHIIEPDDLNQSNRKSLPIDL